MGRERLTDALLLGPIIAIVIVETVVVRPMGAVLMRLRRVGPLRRLQQRLGGLPPGAALPLFLVPEAASRAGWLTSAWLLMNGAVWEAFLVYAGTKLFASLTALWIYQACEPALLRVRWFAAMHARLQRMRVAFRPSSPRLVRLRERVRVSVAR